MWRKHQEQRKVNSKIKLASITLGVLVLLLGLAKIFSLMDSFNHSLGLNFKSVYQSSWNGKTAINLVYTSVLDNKTEVALINYQPVSNKIAILHLSDQIYTELPKNYGSWKIGSIYQLGEEDKLYGGPYLLKLSIARLIGLPIDGIIVTNSPVKPEQIISRWHSNPLNILTNLYDMKTDLSLPDAFKIFWQASKVRPDKIKSLDLAQSSITESKLLPDSSRVLGLNAVKMDVFIRDNLEDNLLQTEAQTVAVFNATNHQGLGSEVARQVTLLGANVVIISNTDNLQDKSMVTTNFNIAPQTKNNETAKRLSQIFAPYCERKDCVSTDPKITASRAKINVVIGEDYYNLWYKR